MKAIFVPAILIVAGCVSSVTATPTQTRESAARAAINDVLRNPSSGSMRNFRSYALTNGETVTCAEVNAQNAYGGMTGYQPYAVNEGAGRAPIVWWDGPAAFECGQLAQGRSGRF